MLTITVAEFSSDINKYLKLALTEKIALQSKDGVIELAPRHVTNPSPSNDPWFDDPKNISELDKAMKELREMKEGNVNGFTLSELKEMLA